jgi:hypothetical protein
MGHALLRNWQLRAVILSVITVCFGVLAATAGAVTVNPVTTSTTTCENLIAPTNDDGNCTFSGSGSDSYTGQAVQPVGVDPALCGTQENDPTDFVCGHLGLNFNNVSGTVTVNLANFDTDRVDLDLCLTDSTGVILLCTTGTGNTESLTFTVSCTDTRYEILVVETDTDFTNPPTLADPVSYTGGVTANVTSCSGGTANGGPGTKGATGHKITGGGQVGFASTPTDNYSLNVIQSGTGFKGKVQINDATCTFRGIYIDAVSWNDTTHDARIAGRGYYKNAPNVLVTFTAEAQDNGQGSNATDPDFFTMDKCNGGGQVVHGNITYHSS